MTWLLGFVGILSQWTAAGLVSQVWAKPIINYVSSWQFWVAVALFAFSQQIFEYKGKREQRES